ncbi:hypothetical protein COCNU_06G010690 [Cocos nucifera]|uniref:Uncharacterized protein n=1 Tax=Cocos nucifera TaxID=13894 RepID=A0A8K0IC50_COCNU|nr:hypothetical protein COCNU_06G010690 [Cocos nucifera]
MWDTPTLEKNLLYAVVRRRDMELEELLNQGFSYLLDRKINEEEEKLSELWLEVSRIFDLEAKVKELEGMVISQDEMLVARDKALLIYQRDLEHWKTATGCTMEEYKSSKDFAEEVMEATGETFESGFNSCKDLVGKLFSNLDLGGVTMEAGLALVAGLEVQLAPEVVFTVEAPQPTPEVPTILLKPKMKVPDSTEVLVPALAKAPVSTPALAEVISLEDDPADAVAPEALQMK